MSSSNNEKKKENNSESVTIYDNIKKQLKERYFIHIKINSFKKILSNNIIEKINNESSIHPSKGLIEELRDIAINTDFREIGDSCLPNNINKKKSGKLGETLLLQIVKSKNMNQPKIRQHLDSNARLIMLRISDGKQIVSAIEYEKCNRLRANIAPGTKILLKQSTPILHGKLLLGPSHLGNPLFQGRVENLINAWEVKMSRQHVSQIAVKADLEDDDSKLEEKKSSSNNKKKENKENNIMGAPKFEPFPTGSQKKNQFNKNKRNDIKKDNRDNRNNNKRNDNRSNSRNNNRNNNRNNSRSNSRHNNNNNNNNNDKRYNKKNDFKNNKKYDNNKNIEINNLPKPPTQNKKNNKNNNNNIHFQSHFNHSNIDDRERSGRGGSRGRGGRGGRGDRSDRNDKNDRNDRGERGGRGGRGGGGRRGKRGGRGKRRGGKGRRGNSRTYDDSTPSQGSSLADYINF